MLNQIRTSAANASAESTPQEMLLGCHARIRHFSAMALRLAESQNASPEEIVRAAQGLHRYFTVALPLHEQDENLSLHPRLKRAAALPARANESTMLRELAGPAADAMVEQHESIDQLIERLLPLWTILQHAPQRLPELAPEMRELAQALKTIFDAHLQLEEESIFPSIHELLSQQEVQALLQEMKARRADPSNR